MKNKMIKVTRMSMEKNNSNHKVLDHPVAAWILLTFWGYVFYQIVAATFLMIFGEAFTGYGAALGAVIALVLHKEWFSPEYKGSVAVPVFRSKDVKYAFLFMAVMIIVLDLFSFIGNEISFSMVSLGTALMAGIGEEMYARVLPESVMMRDWMDEKHIPFVVYSTAIVFGLIHFINMTGGAALDDTLVQVFIAIGLGVMFAAFYLRTGNILLCMILHAVHDMLGFMVVGATDSKGVIQELSMFDTISSFVIGIAGFAIGTYLIRKSVRTDIVEVWKERWSRE